MPFHTDTHMPEVTVRLARTHDAGALTDLAALDSTEVPPGDVIVAETSGRIVAALPVSGGRALADPFRRTESLVRMLQLCVKGQV